MEVPGMRDETQVAQLIAIMETGRWITPLEAMDEIGCMRLPARIKDIKKLGYVIEDDWVTYTNAQGKTKRFKKYRIVGVAA
jgi:hypothetical protein